MTYGRINVEMVTGQEEWADRAVCQTTDPESFYPEKGSSTKDAKQVCAGCPVRVECLQWALDNNEEFGVWGGYSERERRKIKRGELNPADIEDNEPRCQHCGKKFRPGHRAERYCSSMCRRLVRAEREKRQRAS
ncbi:WhiB family transcription factor [Mycobacterium phage MooMoo]|uniref:WhiB family transcription factor n=1 Tax=Mycobacterium phage MooMoo TaxID=2108127 RepID=A0A2P1JRB7_9CAUD|nr:WhiB family transcription factor [Mycobacterium phage MooMoo]AVO21663.1 WhiB family transcription factor [Mycobacterium phage MooMoo]